MLPPPRAGSKVGLRAVRGGMDGEIRLETHTSLAQADHSFSGVVFDVQGSSSSELQLRSLWLAGQLGTISVFATQGGWREAERGGQLLARCGWGNANDVIDPRRWQLVARQVFKASWDKKVEVRFQEPVRVVPGATVGLYAHSDAVGDGGIIYQSCGRYRELAASEHLRLLPGLGHTSPTPFDTSAGWWAASLQRLRGPVGAISYSARPWHWALDDAADPAMLPSMRSAVRAVFLSHARLGE